MSSVRARVAAFVLAALAAALAPLLGRPPAGATTASQNFPGWPTHYEGHALAALPLTRREVGFVQDFPGRVGRFTDGRREIIVRWVGAPTRLLHPAADCFRGSGFAVKPLPVRRDAAGNPMGCFRARHQTDDITVCELLRDARGETWPDVSAWYWHALLGATAAPWWSFVVAERS